MQSRPKSPIFNKIAPGGARPSWLLRRIPGMRRFNNLNIGVKLNIGFGILVLLMLLVVGLIWAASRQATRNIDLTEAVRVPSALASARAQSNLLKMQTAVRGYLVLSDLKNIDDYNKAKDAFETNLAELETLSTSWTDATDIQRLEALKSTFADWSPISERLFELHDNPAENQPALRLENMAFSPRHKIVLEQVDRLIALQQARSPSVANRELLAGMVDLKTSFEAMATNLHAYATAGDLAFKFGYAANLKINSAAWGQLQTQRALLSASQEALIIEMIQSRQTLLTVPLDIFAAIESERAFEDLYLFRTEVEPQAEQMLQLLTEMTTGQQALLRADLNKGRQSLAGVQLQTLVSGLVALVMGLSMAYVFKQNIAGPVQRLITTAEQISAGDFTTKAEVESKDEIGRLAMTLNLMTQRLRHTIDSLARQTQQLETIVEISQRLTSKLDVGELTRDVIRRIKLGFGYRHTAIYLLDEAQGALMVSQSLASPETDPNQPAPHIALQDETSPIAQAARTAEIVLRPAEPTLDPPTHTEMAVPIIAGERVIGVLNVQDDDVTGLGPKDTKLMRTLANQVAIALTNANLFEQTQKALAETEKLYRMSQGMVSARSLSELIAAVVTGGNMPIFNRAVLNVFEYNKYGEVEAMEVIANWYDGHGTPPSPPNTRYLRAVNSIINLFLSQEPLFFTDAQRDKRLDPATHEVVQRLNIRTMVVLPLWTQARQVGVLLLEGDAPHDFSRREIRPYLSLLGQLTVAVENQRLYEQTQQRAAELAIAKDAAEMASRAKSDFLASMSHELRTPLNGILGYAQILKRDGRLAPPQENAVKVIQDSGEHLLTLINDILDLAKIEARKLELNLTDFQFSRFLEGIIGMFGLRAQQKETVRFAYEAVTELPTVIRADEKRLRQILLNLLSNALKFTDTGQVVFQVGAVRPDQQDGRNGVRRPQPGQSAEQFQPGQLRFEIIDTGIGISPPQLEKIFLPFEQACEPERRAEGTGLGLTITQNLVEAMSGRLQVKSSLGQGSHFSLEVEFPMLWSPVTASSAGSQPWPPLEAATAPLPEEELTPPPPEELAILLDLAMKGEIRALKRRVSHVEQLDDKFKPFARKLSQFVKKYDEVQILALIGKYAG